MSFVLPMSGFRPSGPRESDKILDLIGRENIHGMDTFIAADMCKEIMGMGEKMKYEGNRLASYKNWPYETPVYPTQLAKAGFYFSGHRDEVICFACEGKIDTWQNGDKPLEEHMRHYPTCPFVCGNCQGVNMEAPSLDEETFPHVTRLDRKVDELMKQIAETNRRINIRSGATENTNMTSSITPGQVMTSTRTQNMGVTRGVLTLREEAERLKTFVGNWRDSWPVTVSALAKAGFYYCGPGDMVQCAWCFGKLQGWENGDNPLAEHARHFPACAKFGERQSVAPSSLVNIHNPNPLGDATSNEFSEEELGILTMRPCNPQYAIEATRFESFRNRWPSNLTQTPEQLASAGFFYVGYADNVKCFFCDGGLCNWESDDEPWTEHARWFPKCGFLRQVKGPQFIQRVQEVGVNGGPVLSDDPSDDFPSKLAPTTSAPQPSVAAVANVIPVHSGPGASPASGSNELTSEQKREVRAAMSSPSVAKALETGIPKEAIQTAIQERLLAGNGHFSDDESLIVAALAVNERLQAESSERTADESKTPPRNIDAAACEDNSSPGPSGSKKNKKKRKNKEAAAGASDEEPKSPDSMSIGDDSNGADAKSLEEENAKLKEQRLCKICMDEEVSIVLLPCGHFVSCVKCAPALRNCPICRNAIKGTVRTFMA